MTHEDDRELAHRAQKGDGSAFETLIGRYLHPLYAFVARFIGAASMTDRSDDAADIVQEVCVKAWKRLASFDVGKPFKPWIFAIARNAAIDWSRRRRYAAFSAFDDSSEGIIEAAAADEAPLPDEIFARAELADELERAVASLGADQREVILLHDIEDLTFQEISDALGISLNTLKSRHRRACARVREFLEASRGADAPKKRLDA